jgi:hypothetical protein
MRRTLLTVVGVLALTLAVPGAALAHHGHGRHRHLHHKAKGHHARFRFVHIGASGTSTGASGPTGPTGPAGPPPPENAGKVTSYVNNVLTLTLNDNSTVSGKVTERTRIRCVKATPPTGTEPPDEGLGDDNGQGDDQSRGDMSESGGSWGDHKDDGDDDDDGETGAAEPPCDTSLLVPGAVVRAAELRIGPGGTEFESIVLVR